MTPETKNWSMKASLMVCWVIRSFAGRFNGMVIVTYWPARNLRTTTRMRRRWWMLFTKLIQRRRGGSDLCWVARMWRKWVEFRDSGADESYQFDKLICFSLLHFITLMVQPGTIILRMGFTIIGLQSRGAGVSPWPGFAKLSGDLFYLLVTSLYENIQPRWQVHREGDNLMVRSCTAD